MRTAPFRYTRASSLAEVFEALAGGAVILAGGQSLVPAMRLRQSRPDHLVDINRVPELDGIDVTPDGGLELGALARHADLVASPLVKARTPGLVEAAARIGDVQVRNRGTIGGNLCFADSRANLPPALIALGARARIAGPGGARVSPVEALFAGFQQTTLAPTELLVAVEMPPWPDGTRGAYLELTRQPNDVPVVNVAVVVSGSPVTAVGIGVGGLGPTPLRADAVERALRGAPLTAAAVDAAVAGLTADPWQPAAEPDGPPAVYRGHAARVLLRRALLACARSTGDAGPGSPAARYADGGGVRVDGGGVGADGGGVRADEAGERDDGR